MTYTEIVALIQNNLADFSNITPDRHREVHQEILDYITNTQSIIGGFFLEDIGVGSGTLATFGYCTSATKNSSGNRSSVFVEFPVLISDSYMVTFDVENINSVPYEVLHPVTDSKTLNSFNVFFDETGGSQNLKITFKISLY